MTLDALKELESMINDPSKRGVKLDIEKLIVEEENAKGGKAPAKGAKAPAPGEESKPVKGEAWLDLTPFMFPGSTISTQRIFISTIIEPKEEQEASAEVKSQVDEEGQPGTPNERVFEQRHCYIDLKVSLSNPINPAIDHQLLPQSADIARKTTANMPPLFPNVKDAVRDYQNSIHAVV